MGQLSRGTTVTRKTVDRLDYLNTTNVHPRYRPTHSEAKWCEHVYGWVRSSSTHPRAQYGLEISSVQLRALYLKVLPLLQPSSMHDASAAGSHLVSPQGSRQVTQYDWSALPVQPRSTCGCYVLACVPFHRRRHQVYVKVWGHDWEYDVVRVQGY